MKVVYNNRKVVENGSKWFKVVDMWQTLKDRFVQRGEDSC